MCRFSEIVQEFIDKKTNNYICYSDALLIFCHNATFLQTFI